MELNLVRIDKKTVFVIEATTSNYLPRTLQDIQTHFGKGASYNIDSFIDPNHAFKRLCTKLVQLERQCLFMSTPEVEIFAGLCSPSFQDMPMEEMYDIFGYLFTRTIFLYATPTLTKLYERKQLFFLSW